MQIEDEVTNDYEGFWGLILEPNRSIQQVVEAAFCITGASFGPNVKGEGRSSVQVLIEKNNFVLANLLPGKIENATLNARFTEGTKMTLSVTGNNAVHLTGFHLPPPESFDYEDEDEYDDEDDDDAMYYGQEDDGEDDDEDDEDDDEDLHHGHEHRIREVTDEEAEKIKEESSGTHALNQAKQARLHRLAQLEAEDDDDEDDDVEGEDDDEEDEDEEENGILHHHDGEEDDEDDDEVDPEEDALLAQAWYRKAYGDKNGDVDEEDEDEDDDDDLHEDDEEALAVRQAVQDLKRGRDAKDSKQQQHQQQQPAKKHAGEDKSGKPAASKTPEPKQPAKQQQQQQQQQQPKKGDSKPNTPAKAQQQQQQQTPKSENKAGKADSKPATPQQQQQQQQQKQNASGNKADAKSPAKQTLAGGLQVQDKKTGSGKKATKGKKVSVRYIGRLDNGKVFDSNTSGKPFSFKLGAGEVIKGWDVGIEGMSVGSERILTIPPPLAYGAKGSLPDIPKNATLTFEVKLLSVD